MIYLDSTFLLASLLSASMVHGALVFRPFLPTVPCSDGSPAGIYTNWESTNSAHDISKHILVFEGGGACTSIEDCQREFKKEPYKFSSSYLPERITGSTILSDKLQPFQNFTKWLVPYCTQDLFLGDIKKGKIGGLFHAGSAIFQQAATTLQDSVGNDVDHLVVVGISAGAIGILNHLQKLQSLAWAVDAKKMQLILDAPSVSDEWDDKNFEETMETYVDLTEHPLCNVSQDPSLLYSDNDLSDVPCCLSSHCMLRHNEHLKHFGSKQATLSSEEAGEVATAEAPKGDILLLDSKYDPFALMSSNPVEVGQATGFVDQMQNIWNGAEVGGSRISRPLETAVYSNSYGGPSGYWVVSSCVAHGFFLPSVDLQHRVCEYGDFSDKDYDFVCGDPGTGVAARLEMVDMKITMWHTTDTWNYAKINGLSIQEIVGAFVEGNHSALGRSSGGLTILQESCNGPNCLDGDTASVNQCQDLLQLEETFDPVPFYLKTAWWIAIGLIVATAALRTPYLSSCLSNKRKISRPSKVLESKGTGRRSFATVDGSSAILPPVVQKTKICVIQNLEVRASNGQKDVAHILTGISLQIHAGSITGLVGRSGSGKTTLLRLLSQKALSGMKVSAGHIRMVSCVESQIAYLRQSDSIQLANMTASDYLMLTASAYGADQTSFADCLYFVEKLFLRKQENLDPFRKVKIKNLSGGQRRILAIASTLLLQPKLLLLDEPLSGLDSASSSLVMEFVDSLSKKYDCAVVMSVHSPSAETLAHLDKAIVLDNGRVIAERSYARDDESFTQSFRDELATLLSASLSHGGSKVVAGVKKCKDSTLEPITEAPDTANLSVKDEHDEDVISNTGTADDPWKDDVACPPSHQEVDTSCANQNAALRLLRWTLKLLREVTFLCQRLHCNYGSDPIDLISLPIVFLIFAMIMRFDDGSPIQEVLVITFFVGLPVNLFRHKIHLSCKMWTSHRLELDDRRIMLISYQLASQTFSFAIPLISLVISHLLGYAVLQWDYQSLSTQVLFSGAYLLVVFQLGRTICVYFRGDYRKFSKFYSIFIYLSFLFGGLLVPTRQLPPWLSWLYVSSFTFWAISGGTLNILKYHGNDGYCVDAISCVASDGSFIARYMGFSPTSTEYLALGVLTLLFFVLSLMEYVLLRHRCAGIKTSILPWPSLPSSLQSEIISPSLSVHSMVSVSVPRQDIDIDSPSTDISTPGTTGQKAPVNIEAIEAIEATTPPTEDAVRAEIEV